MNQRKLHISADDNGSLPLDAVTQTFAILGIRGSGKTNTAVVMMEEMLKLDQQCVALDPTNAWYGIRSSRDGKHPGFKVYVFGGPHGDLPLEGTHGQTMADFVVETGASVIFSLRHLSMNDQRRFAMDFGERLHHIKGRPENRTPLCLFLDEADEFVPQRIPKGYERMFGAYDRLVRRDRNCGLGVVLISQRPQVINKDTLSQIETLVCHRLLHKLDRKAVREAWVEGHDVEGKAEEFFGGLAALAKGEAWIWSPEWLDIFARLHIRYRETFDSSATPKAGERVRIAHKLAEVDLGKLKERLAQTVEKAKADDPKELRKQIDVLNRALTAEKMARVNTDVKVVEKLVEVPKIPEFVFGYIKRMDAAMDAATGVSLEFTKQLMKERDKKGARTATAIDRQYQQGTFISRPLNIPAKRELTTPSTNGSGGTLKAGASRMLAALVQWSPEGMPEGQMRSHAGMKKSGTFNTYMSHLRSGGYIEERDGKLYATQSGIDYFGGNVPSSPSTTEEVLALWDPKLKEGARRMLHSVVDRYRMGGVSMTSADLAASVGMAVSGTFNTYLSHLRTARLVLTTKGYVIPNKETLLLQ